MVLQLVSQEPVAPCGLNVKVPRHIETICLKCLEKDPARRYASAGELAIDLGRFLNDEPVKARPMGAIKRGFRWVRASISSSVAGGEHGVGDLPDRRRKLVPLAADGNGPRGGNGVARSGPTAEGIRLDRSRRRLGPGSVLLGRGGPAELHLRLDRARRELQLAPRLEAIHMTRLTLVEGRFNYPAEVRFNNAQADRGYEVAFREAGLGEVKQDPSSVAARVKASAIRGTLVAALDDWAVCVQKRIGKIGCWKSRGVLTRRPGATRSAILPHGGVGRGLSNLSRLHG